MEAASSKSFVEAMRCYDCSLWSENLLLGPMNPCRFEIILEYLDVVSLTRLAESSPNLPAASALLNLYCLWMGRHDKVGGPGGNWSRLLKWLRYTPVCRIRHHRTPQPCPRLDSSWYRRLAPSSQSVLFHHFQSCFDVRMLRAVRLTPRFGIAFHDRLAADLTFAWYTLEIPGHTVSFADYALGASDLVWTSWPSRERSMSMWDWPLNAPLPHSVRNILLHVALDSIRPKMTCFSSCPPLGPCVDLTFPPYRSDSEHAAQFFTLRLGSEVSRFVSGNFGLASLLTKEVATRYRFVK